jgi:hypothetical protein
MDISIEAAGVLVTLMYLAVELRANNRIAKTNGHRDIIKQHTTWYALHKSPETAVILTKGALNFSDMKPEEKIEYDNVQHQFFHICEQVFYMGRGKLIPANVYDAFMFGAVLFLNSPGAKEWWKNSKKISYAPEFVAAVEKTSQNTKHLPDPLESHPPLIYARQLLG